MGKFIWLLLLLPTLTQAQPDWLAGCWQSQQNNQWIEEQWSSLKHDLMLGMGRTLTPGKPAFFEFLRIQKDDAGSWHYYAQPRGKAPVKFSQQSITNNSVSFSNPEHDFPKLLHYEREVDELQVWVSGNVEDKTQGLHIRFNPCS